MARQDRDRHPRRRDLRFVARSGSGHPLVLDDGRGDTGMRPAELVPIGARRLHGDGRDLDPAQEAPGRDRLRGPGRAATQMDDHPNAFTRIDVVHVVEGPDIDIEAVRRAIELSATKYCSVGATLSSGMTEIHHAYVVRDMTTGTEQADEVLVLGPLASERDRGDGAARGWPRAR